MKKSLIWLLVAQTFLCLPACIINKNDAQTIRANWRETKIGIGSEIDYRKARYARRMLRSGADRDTLSLDAVIQLIQ
jgi:hypothetical protein